MRAKKLLSVLFLIIVALACVYAVHKFLQNYSLHQIIKDLTDIPLSSKAAALVLTAASYLFLTVYDFLGMEYLGKKLSKRYVLFTSFVSYAFSNSIGLSILASGSLRYRYYSSWGLSFSEITRVIIFTSVTLWVGLFTVGGFAFLAEPASVMPGLLSHISLHMVGVLFLCAAAAYMLILIFVKKPLAIYNSEFPLPSPAMGAVQIVAGAVDWILAGSVLYVLMPQGMHMSFPAFIGIYLIAQTAGLISHVPGGVLVFEGILLSFFPPELTPSVISSVLVYRVTYYILPLLTAAVTLGLSESYHHAKKLEGLLGWFNRIYRTLIPDLIFAVVFICGAYMLFTGAIPINPIRFPLVEEIIPLPVMESSHFLESLIGMGLIILSRGLRKRVDLSYQLTIILLIAGTVFALFKGAEYETSFFTVAIIAAMLPARKLFNRKSPFFAEVMTKGWILSIFLILLLFTWLGFFSYKHVEYSSSLWWTFTLKGDAPRFLRALLGTGILLLAVTLYKFMLPSKSVSAGDDEKSPLDGIVASSAGTYAYLAYLNDKNFLMNETKDMFIMYGVSGRSFISMGDPVGRADQTETAGELIRDFRRLSARHGCTAVFYEINARLIPQYIDAGFRIFKIGEEARVRLDTFSLTGSHWSGTRNLMRKMEKEGFTFTIADPSELDTLLPELKKISDEWLESKSTREKKFSLGCFDEAYLKKTRIAVVLKDEKPAAFVNILPSAGKEELSVDLMRYGKEAPAGVMEYLFVSMMLYGQAEGFGYFNLGMAPLSGMDIHNFSPFWNRVANTVFNHGERFYNFKGLRSYKDKFRPEWEPKYIAVQGVLQLPKTLANIASLISGGTAGIFRK